MVWQIYDSNRKCGFNSCYLSPHKSHLMKPNTIRKMLIRFVLIENSNNQDYLFSSPPFSGVRSYERNPSLLWYYFFGMPIDRSFSSVQPMLLGHTSASDGDELKELTFTHVLESTHKNAFQLACGLTSCCPIVPSERYVCVLA